MSKGSKSSRSKKAKRKTARKAARVAQSTQAAGAPPPGATKPKATATEPPAKSPAPGAPAGQPTHDDPPEPARAAAPTPRATFFGLALLSAATLVLEIALTRVLSVSLWYHFAFMVVSTALFGLGFAGVLLALRRRAAAISTRLIALAALATPIAFALGYWLYNLVPFEPVSLGMSSRQWLYLPLCYLAVTLPFFCSGLTIAAVLTRHASRVHRLYLFDLAGAGIGSLAVVWLLPGFGGSGTVLVAAALAAGGAALIAVEHDRRTVMAAAAVGLVLLIATPMADRLIPVRISSNKWTAKALATPGVVLESSWNTMSRIDLVKMGRGGEERAILIDAGTAMTRVAHAHGPIDRLGPTHDQEGTVVGLFDRPNVLVVGSGGGREVLVGLRNGAGHVTGVEINPSINRVVRELADFTGHLAEHPRVDLVTDEARSYLRRSKDHYQIIWCPHTISNAALASGSLSLAESYLLTLEAFDDFLDHLGDDGVLYISRPEAHLPRLVATMRAAFEARGRTDIADSIMVWREHARGLSFHSELLLSMRPFTPDQIAKLMQALQRGNLEPLYVPGQVGVAPYPDILNAADPTRVALPFPAILEPATDNRPFFNQRVRFSAIGWSDLSALFSEGKRARAALEVRPTAEAALLLLLIESAALALIFIVVPLLVFRRRALAGSGRLRTLASFTAIGLGFIVVEVGLIQRFTLYLGRPVVLFATVLGTLLVLSGLGSGFAARFTRRDAPWRACATAAGVVLALTFLAPVVVDATLAWPGPVRVMCTALLLAPAGFVMGMPFPLLVRQLEHRYPERIPWAWGVNGFASVVGSIGALILGMTIGFTGALLFGVAAYACAAIVTREVAT